MSEYAILKDKKVIPVKDVLEWAKWLEEPNLRKDKFIKSTTVGQSKVSTVFLGLNHSFHEDKPLWFETLVFDGPLDGEMYRYETYEEAEAGHDLMVERVRANLRTKS